MCGCASACASISCRSWPCVLTLSGSPSDTQELRGTPRRTFDPPTSINWSHSPSSWGPLVSGRPPPSLPPSVEVQRERTLSELLSSFIYFFYVKFYFKKCVFMKLLIIYTPEFIKLSIHRGSRRVCAFFIGFFFSVWKFCMFSFLYSIFSTILRLSYCIWIYLPTPACVL